MSDYDIHSCGYYCDRHACIVAQRNELRDKLFSDQAVKTYSGGKPNYTQPIEPPNLKGDDFERAFYRDWEAGKVKRVFESEPMIDGWPLYSGLPPSIPAIKVQDKSFEEFAQSFAQRPQPEPTGWVGYFEGRLVSFLQSQGQVNEFLQNTEPVGQVFPVYTNPPKKDERVIDKSMAKRIATQLGWEPKREWVGLTDDEIFTSWKYYADIVREVEAKLKEKNA